MYHIFQIMINEPHGLVTHSHLGTSLTLWQNVYRLYSAGWRFCCGATDSFRLEKRGLSSSISCISTGPGLHEAEFKGAEGTGTVEKCKKSMKVVQDGGPKPLRMIWRVSPEKVVPAWCLVDVGWPFHDTSLGSKSICIGSIHVKTGLLCVIFEWFLLFLLKLLNDRRGLYYLHYSIDEALSQFVTGIPIYQTLSKGWVWFLILLIILNSVVHGGGLVLPILRRQMRYEAARGNQILLFVFVTYID